MGVPITVPAVSAGAGPVRLAMRIHRPGSAMVIARTDGLVADDAWTRWPE
ncbi:hypothetical protein [Streptomyces sp. NPDC050982]